MIINTTNINQDNILKLLNSQLEELLIEDISLESLDFLINNLPNSSLKSLNLSFNEEIGFVYNLNLNNIFNSNLKFLELRGDIQIPNDIKIPINIIQKSPLETLNLVGINSLSEESIIYLINILPILKLKSLYLGRLLNLSDVTIQKLVEILPNSHLESLSLVGKSNIKNSNGMNSNQVKKILNVIPNTNIISLNLRNNEILTDTFKIEKGNKELPLLPLGLKSLEFSINNSNKNTFNIEILCNILKDINCKLETLNIYNLTNENIEKIEKSLYTNINLLYSNLSEKKISDFNLLVSNISEEEEPPIKKQLELNRIIQNELQKFYRKKSRPIGIKTIGSISTILHERMKENIRIDIQEDIRNGKLNESKRNQELKKRLGLGTELPNQMLNEIDSYIDEKRYLEFLNYIQNIYYKIKKQYGIDDGTFYAIISKIKRVILDYILNTKGIPKNEKIINVLSSSSSKERINQIGMNIQEYKNALLITKLKDFKEKEGITLKNNEKFTRDEIINYILNGIPLLGIPPINLDSNLSNKLSNFPPNILNKVFYVYLLDSDILVDFISGIKEGQTSPQLKSLINKLLKIKKN